MSKGECRFSPFAEAQLDSLKIRDDRVEGAGNGKDRVGNLLVTPHKKNSISKAMQMLGRYYVQCFNFSYERTGMLWEGRYKASLIDSDSYALICYRYIEFNPVRANSSICHSGPLPTHS